MRARAPHAAERRCLRIGDYTLEFDARHGGDVGAQQAAERIVSNPGDTVFLDADKHQALLAMLQETEAEGRAAPDANKVGVLRVY